MNAALMHQRQALEKATQSQPLAPVSCQHISRLRLQNLHKQERNEYLLGSAAEYPQIVALSSNYPTGNRASEASLTVWETTCRKYLSLSSCVNHSLLTESPKKK